MDEKFKRFNEITFEADCKTAIDNAVKKAAMRKQKRGELERPITDLTDADLYRLSAVSPAAEDEMQECTHFYIADRKSYLLYHGVFRWLHSEKVYGFL